MGDPQLTVEDLYVRFPTSRGTVEAVNGITFRLDKGQMLGIVGESGCGKTVMMKAVMDLLPPTAEVNGSITFDGEDVFSMDKARRKHFYGVDIAMVFQNPMTSLNPVKRIGDQLMEGMLFHRGLSKAAARARSIELLEQMQIPKPRERIRQYPHELSGGMR
ncbi:MAG TPA: dipeptide/oligopeptide/nickel ABC transporter ATP-binding protein, partial [Acidimicrobiaceae bacterium]|nr:dipeptide/oligopeptide/nickel ABC transporter ATP-binding protein [Acidimicrobiaceae bacterium]